MSQGALRLYVAGNDFRLVSACPPLSFAARIWWPCRICPPSQRSTPADVTTLCRQLLDAPH